MKIYKFEQYHNWTSYSKASVEYYEQLESQNYNNFPEFVEVDGKKIKITEAIYFSEKVTKASFAEIHPGVFARIVTLSVSRDYHKPNGNGHHHSRLEIKSLKSLKFSEVE